MADDRTDADPDVQSRLLLERLLAIIGAVDGRNVGCNDEELWLEPGAAPGVQLRLAADRSRRCYDRSANFAISYGGRSSDEPKAAGLADAVARIKAADAAPIDDAAAAFSTAAHAVVRALAFGGGGHGGTTTPHDAIWEAQGTRALNVVFLDLCAALIGHRPHGLVPLHWGYWPAGATANDGSIADPFDAYSDNLLGYIPDRVVRILDVGCGLGANAAILAARGKRVTALSPIAHHCETIAAADLPGVEVQCARFEDLSPESLYDLLLFSESVNHFPLGDEFLRHCETFLTPAGFVLLADDLSDDRARILETQRILEVVRVADITANVAPMTRWWETQMSRVGAAVAALQAVLRLSAPDVAVAVDAAVAALPNVELKLLLSGQAAPPQPKGRYMIYLLQRRGEGRPS